MKVIQAISIFIFSLFGVSQAGAADSVKWPLLSGVKHIKDRPATQKDVDAGNAVFAAVVKGQSVGKPIKMTIPQYAFHIDGKTKKPVIIIQAEDAQGIKMVGAIDLAGESLAATLKEFELIGTNPKSSKKWNKTPSLKLNSPTKSQGKPEQGFPFVFLSERFNQNETQVSLKVSFLIPSKVGLQSQSLNSWDSPKILKNS